MAERKRKTKDPCENCHLHRERCICPLIPRLDLRTRVTLVIHFRELRRTSNSGTLALKALSNSALFVRGQGERLDLAPALDPAYRNVLFYPAEDAMELNAEFMALDPRPVNLIVPDGNWRQASKVAVRHPELASLPRVKISRVNAAKYHLRKETTPEGMSTLEAIARALGVTESEATGERMLDLYQAKLKATLIGRGIVPA
jgi:DTW domain-containing protein YfiP